MSVRRSFRRPALLLLTVACGASVGCLGGTYNPSYFPYYLPPGDVVQTHAKPPGLGYFDNYDPKACRLEVTPACISNKLGTQQVLIATVYDKDGQPRRKRRVEWILDGPGYIVEVDESGYLPGRGYLMDNKRAVSYTDYFEHKIAGGANGRGEFTIGPGQTWCIVSSAKEGETTVTAYAPEIFDKDRNTITSKLTWADTQFGFPPPVVSRSGGEAELSTTLRRYAGQESPDGLKVRYKVLDGAPAVLVSNSSDRSSVSASGGQKEAEVSADADGKAAVRVVQPSPQGGKTRIAVEVLKPDGTTVVGRQETTVEWATAQLSFDVLGPKAAALDREATFTLVVANAGKADSPAVTVRSSVPDGAEFVRSDPPAKDGRDLSWPVGPVGAGKKQTVAVTVRPRQKGALTMAAAAESADGSRAEQRATATVDTAKLKLALEVPDAVAPGEWVGVTVAVTNPSPAPAENVTAWVVPDPGLAHASGKSPVEVAVGTVPAGETKRVEVSLKAEQAGRHFVRANATADGGLADRAEVGLDVRAGAARPAPPAETKSANATSGRSALTLELSEPPAAVAAGQKATVQVTVRNRGTAPAKRVEVTVTATDGLTPSGGTGADRKPASADGRRLRFGVLDELAAGSTAVYVAELEGVNPGPARVQVDVRSEDLTQPLREEQATRVAK